MRGSIGIFGIVVAAVRLASAEPVNLLATVPTTVAVSSTVDNAALLPQHLVDGDLATAWNSQTDELAGSWFAVRLPDDVSVTAIKLTVGFTKQDKKLGDLFLENPRIKRVRVIHGKTVVEQTLDIANRGLQVIPIVGGGGDYKIEVLEVVMGTKPSWRETCVSELEIWGTAKLATPTKPTVQVATLDPVPAVTEKDCKSAMFPGVKGNKIGDGDLIGAIDVYDAGNDRFVCHLRHGAHPDKVDEGARSHELAVITAKHKLLASRVEEDTHGGPQEITDFNGGNPMNVETGTVTVKPFALTSGETAFHIDVVQDLSGPMLGESRTKSTVYRVTNDGLVPVLKFESWTSDGESTDSDRCSLTVGAFPKTGKQTLPDLDVACVKESGRFHHERAREIIDEPRTEHYRFNGSVYVKR